MKNYNDLIWTARKEVDTAICKRDAHEEAFATYYLKNRSREGWDWDTMNELESNVWFAKAKLHRVLIAMAPYKLLNHKEGA